MQHGILATRVLQCDCIHLDRCSRDVEAVRLTHDAIKHHLGMTVRISMHDLLQVRIAITTDVINEVVKDIVFRTRASPAWVLGFQWSVGFIFVADNGIGDQL